MNLDRALAIQGWMEPDELAWIVERAQASATVIEVGSWKGRTTRAILDNSLALVHVVDDWRMPSEAADLTGDLLALEGRDAIVRAWLGHVGQEPQVRLWPMASVVAAKFLAPAPFVFIDAGHSFADCVCDLASYAPLVHQDGILAGHDYGVESLPGVKEAVDFLFGPRVQQGPGSIWWVQR